MAYKLTGDMGYTSNQAETLEKCIINRTETTIGEFGGEWSFYGDGALHSARFLKLDFIGATIHLLAIDRHSLQIMSFFDFIFPEQAQASHLRRLANQGQEQAAFQHRERLAVVQMQRLESSLTKSLEQRIERLERELGEAGIVVEALLELLEQGGLVSRSELAIRTADIDSRDGIMDGRITPPDLKPFEARRPWPKEEA